MQAGNRVHLSAGWGWRGKVFVFDRPSYDPALAATEAAMQANCAKAARAALEAFTKQAEPWWEQKAAARQAGRE